MSAFVTREDIANYAATLLGARRITTLTDSTKFARDAAFVIDKVRAAELRRSVWTSATRRAVMRSVVVGSTAGAAFIAWSSVTTYAVGDVISYNNLFWISTVGSNLNNLPNAAGAVTKWVPYFGPMNAPLWDTAVQYYPGDIVYVSSVLYIAVVANLAQTVVANTTYWHIMAGAVPSIAVNYYPGGYEKDPTVLRKAYRLPANFLRLAPQDPKSPGVAHQNTGAGMQYNDWELEAGYLYTADTAPFILRFVADQVDVSTMDPLLCQAWGTRLALHLCETTTQSPGKKAEVRDEYSRVINLAKMVNAVEAGTTEDEPEEAPQQQGRGQ